MPGSPEQGSVFGRWSLQSIGVYRPAGLNCRSLPCAPRMGETASTLGGHTQVLRVKAEIPHKPGPDLLPGLGGSPWGWGWLWFSGIIKDGGQYSGDLCELWVESDILSPWHWDLTQQPISSSAEMPQARQPTGWEMALSISRQAT